MGDPVTAIQTSVEKLRAVFSKTQELEAETEEEARMLSALTMVGPMVSRGLPSDPVELDRMLLTGAKWALSLRSDDADPPAIVLVEESEELLEAPAEEEESPQ